MDKHERQYVCSNPGCNGVTFGDKAGFRRHERAQHGTVRLLCPFITCPRHTRGFRRKTTFEIHLAKQHQAGNRSISAVPTMSSAPSEFTERDDNGLFNDSNATTSLACDNSAQEIKLHRAAIESTNISNSSIRNESNSNRIVFLTIRNRSNRITCYSYEFE